VPFLRPEGCGRPPSTPATASSTPTAWSRPCAAEADRLAARSCTGAEVTAIEPAPAGRLDLRAGDRHVRAEVVVNAAGPAAGRVAALCGPSCRWRRCAATWPMSASRAAPPRSSPCASTWTPGSWCAAEASGGFVVAWSDPDDPPSWDTGVDPAFLEQLAPAGRQPFPLLEDLPLDPRSAGPGCTRRPPTTTPSSAPPPRLPALVHCAGFGGHGVMHAPAAGRAVAELVTLGGCAPSTCTRCARPGSPRATWSSRRPSCDDRTELDSECFFVVAFGSRLWFVVALDGAGGEVDGDHRGGKQGTRRRGRVPAPGRDASPTWSCANGSRPWAAASG
jgi:hypothetical protein